ncbi:MAG: hypothetical protein ABW252_01795 [Polyangiales bacterium]
MHIRRLLRNHTGQLTALFIGLSAMLGAAPASAAEDICGAAIDDHPGLRTALDIGGSWTANQAPGQGPVPTLRFAEIGGCAYVSAPGWDWFSLQAYDGVYQGHGRRQLGNLVEVVMLELRFVGTHIAYDLYFASDEKHSAGNRVSGTLYYRP